MRQPDEGLILFQVRLPQALHAKLLQVAEDERRSMAFVVRELIEKEVARRAEEREAASRAARRGGRR